MILMKFQTRSRSPLKLTKRTLCVCVVSLSAREIFLSVILVQKKKEKGSYICLKSSKVRVCLENHEAVVAGAVAEMRAPPPAPARVCCCPFSTSEQRRKSNLQTDAIFFHTASINAQSMHQVV